LEEKIESASSLTTSEEGEAGNKRNGRPEGNPDDADTQTSSENQGDGALGGTSKRRETDICKELRDGWRAARGPAKYQEAGVGQLSSTLAVTNHKLTKNRRKERGQ